MRSRHRGHPAAGRLDQCVRNGGRERECGVRGEHHREPRTFHQGTVLRPAHRAVVRIRTQQALRQFAQHRFMRRDIGATDIVGDPARTIGKSGIAQVLDQHADRGVVQRAGFDTPADRQRHQQDRVAERIFLGAGGGARGQLQEFLGERPCPIEWSVRHHRTLRCIVQCSKMPLEDSSAAIQAITREPGS